MKYETPELTALTAIKVIQSDVTPFTVKAATNGWDGNIGPHNETVMAYADWE